MIREKERAKIVVPNDVVNREYLYQKERHSSGVCHWGCWGWVWIEGTLLVKCQKCNYRMKINPKTRKLEHLESPRRAVKDCGAVRTYGVSENL